MNSATKICLVVFFGLFIASLVMQFIRARKRQRLVKRVDISVFPTDDQQKWGAIENSLFSMFKDFRQLQLVRKNSSDLPGDILKELNGYRRFSRAEMLVTVSMILFAVSAYKICS